jgi:phosphatidylinositol 4-kinase A
MMSCASLKWETIADKISNSLFILIERLALQIISMFKRMFQKIKLPLYLYPYRVITTGRGSGVIECVPNTNSRHDVGALTDGSLYDYFLSKYGQPDTVEFQNARRNFIESMAAYTVVSYILNVKDRHNGNILMDEEGHGKHQIHSLTR